VGATESGHAFQDGCSIDAIVEQIVEKACIDWKSVMFGAIA